MSTAAAVSSGTHALAALTAQTEVRPPPVGFYYLPVYRVVFIAFAVGRRDVARRRGPRSHLPRDLEAEQGHGTGEGADWFDRHLADRGGLHHRPGLAGRDWLVTARRPPPSFDFTATTNPDAPHTTERPAMSAPATDPLPLAVWTVMIAKAAALGFITPGDNGTGYRTGEAAGGLS